MSCAEQALESAILTALEVDENVAAVHGNPMRVVGMDSPQPAFPYLEIARHSSEPAGSSGVEASEHRIDLAATSRNDGARAALLRSVRWGPRSMLPT